MCCDAILAALRSATWIYVLENDVTYCYGTVYENLSAPYDISHFWLKLYLE